MGIWAEIKYALNSTIGKKNFIPLDKMIKAERTLIASTENLFDIKILNKQFSDANVDNDVLVARFKLYFQGTININLGGIFNIVAGDTSPSIYYKIIQDDTVIKEGTLDYSSLMSGIIQNVNVQEMSDIYIYFTPTGDWEADSLADPVYTLKQIYVGAEFRQSIGINV